MLDVLQKKKICIGRRKKKIRAKLVSQKKNSCRQIGRKKKIREAKIFYPPSGYI